MRTFVIRNGNFLATVEEICKGMWVGKVFRREGETWTRAFRAGPGGNGAVCKDTYSYLHMLTAADIHHRDTPISVPVFS